MRVLVDTSVLIGYLRSSHPATSATGVLLRAAWSGALTLLFVQGVVDELRRKLGERPDLAARISVADAEELIAALRAVAEPVPMLPEPYPAVCRDRKDDFLIAHAVLASADYLVSWDKDLLDLKQVEGVAIVSPPEFLRILRAAGRLYPSRIARPDRDGKRRWATSAARGGETPRGLARVDTLEATADPNQGGADLPA